MAMNVQIIQPGETRKRHIRRPNFPVAGVLKPFGLYPIMCHPVLPGETLKAASSKWSVVSQPLVNPFVGAWLETWLVYVKLTDIDRDLGEMFISDSFSTSGYTAGGAYERMFTWNGGIDWIRKCVYAVHDSYFLDEGEARKTFGSPESQVPQIKMNAQSWYQNLMFEPTEVALDTTGERDHTEQMRAYEMLTQMQMTELTYESYLEQYGVQSVRLGVGDPEILRFTRSWTKPTNFIDPSDGSPSSAWVWNDEMKLDKDKRFTEPGFILMLAAVRPKMYQKNQLYSMCANLWGFTDWYPAYNLADPAAAIRRIGTDNLVFTTDINEAEGEVQLLYDHRDLLSHGEQFINEFAPKYALPLSDGWSTIAAATPPDVRGQYCDNTANEALFVGTSNDDERCLYEGIVGLTLAGHVQDTTPMGR